MPVGLLCGVQQGQSLARSRRRWAYPTCRDTASPISGGGGQRATRHTAYVLLAWQSVLPRVMTEISLSYIIVRFSACGKKHGDALRPAQPLAAGVCAAILGAIAALRRGRDLRLAGAAPAGRARAARLRRV